MDYESSDILGSSYLPIRDPAAAKWPGFSKTAFFLSLLLAAYVGAVRAWAVLLKWREKSYRLSMRRRHGIPDNDHRPFNVAYAAVLRARREEEVANNRVHRVDVDQLYAEADQHAASVESNFRQRNQYRNGEPAWPSSTSSLPGRFNPLAADTRYTTASGLPSSSSHVPNFADRYNPHPAPVPPVVRFADEIEDTSLPRRSSLFNLNSSPPKHQKRALEDHEIESDGEIPKKTRVEGEEFIDGDEDAEWLPRQKQNRGEKRVMREDDLDEEADVGPPGRPTRGKRARKVSLEKPDVFMASDDNADDMDVDDEGQRRDNRPTTRGKKRDAGSTFKDEEEEQEGGDSAQKARRKRRTVGKRKSDAAAQPSRGQKRDRDADEEGSEGEGGASATPVRGSRKTKKRGKKSKEVREDEEEERSVDEGSASKGKGRPIGEQWESNGVLYKMGANGQRLRQALVKKAARRFNMPLDSQHPDKNANLEVCIETWLTEDEYNDFKARHLLAWQDSPKGTQEPESVAGVPADAPEPPATPTPTVAKGKNLLWDSPASPFPVFAPSPAEKEQFRPKAHFRQSIASDLGGVRVNPFEKVNPLHFGAELVKGGVRSNGRRVVAVRETLAAPGLADSTNSIAAQAPLIRRTFSKWEKQDLEAKAMMKMREANQAKVKEKELKEKLERDKKDREAAAAAAAAAPIPTFSITKPAEPAKSPLSFAPPTPSAAPSSGNSLAPAAAAAAVPTPAAPPAAGPPKLSFGPPPTSDKPPQSAQNPNPFAPPTSTAPTPNLFAPSTSTAPTPNPFASSAPAAAPPSNPFAKTSSSNPTPAPAPASATPNPFAPPSSTPVNASTPAGASSTPTFSFAPQASSAGGSAPAATNTRQIAGRKPSQAPPGSSTGPTFSFAPPAQTQNQAPASGQSEGGQSLLSRMGGVAKPAETAAPAAAPAPPTFSFKPAEQKSAFAAPAQPAQSAFSFKPADQAGSKTASVFAPAQQQQQQQQPQQQQKQPQQAPAPTDAPKFSFAFGGKPAAPSPVTPSSLTGALGSTDPKPVSSTPPTFSFAPPKPAEQASTTPAGTPNFGFGAAKTGQSAFASPTPAAGATEQKPSVFGSSSGFGGFGAGATKSAFGGGGAFGSKPAEDTTKTAPASAFGTGAPASNSGAPASTPASAPAFSFAFGGANNTSSTPATSSATPNPFGAKPSAFGANNDTSSTSAASSTPPNPFGVKASAFGGSSIFGKPAEASTTPQGSPFGAAAATSAFGKPAAGSAFGAPAAAASSPFGTSSAASGSTPSAFGFGQPK
ncbi:hypothetical protein B0H15DRAFT_590025 [Mycena belliarum]|uniref:Uncharacterized protein n=1 Tax=Mycena belliarum TaxID=1033014 RepID=A0AAD6UJG7_9AGAR|nr:hypothetical protein B0H15DRAFT_590025 [Mycena belliae]